MHEDGAGNWTHADGAYYVKADNHSGGKIDIREGINP